MLWLLQLWRHLERSLSKRGGRAQQGNCGGQRWFRTVFRVRRAVVAGWRGVPANHVSELVRRRPVAAVVVLVNLQGAHAISSFLCARVRCKHAL